MVVTFDELLALEGAWVTVQLDLGVSKEQTAINLGYKLAKG